MRSIVNVCLHKSRATIKNRYQLDRIASLFSSLSLSPLRYECVSYRNYIQFVWELNSGDRTYFAPLTWLLTVRFNKCVSLALTSDITIGHIFGLVLLMTDVPAVLRHLYESAHAMHLHTHPTTTAHSCACIVREAFSWLRGM